MTKNKVLASQLIAAQDPNTSTQDLENMYFSSNTKTLDKAIALNPNISKAIFINALSKGIYKGHNPVIDLWLLEDGFLDLIVTNMHLEMPKYVFGCEDEVLIKAILSHVIDRIISSTGEYIETTLFLADSFSYADTKAYRHLFSKLATNICSNNRIMHGSDILFRNLLIAYDWDFVHVIVNKIMNWKHMFISMHCRNLSVKDYDKFLTLFLKHADTDKTVKQTIRSIKALAKKGAYPDKFMIESISDILAKLINN